MKKIFIGILCAFFFILPSYAGVVSNGSTTTNIPDFSVNKKNIGGLKKLTVNDLFSGAGAFSVDFDFPNAVRSMDADFSLQYNSYSTESFNPYGYAWNLNLQPITRSSRKGVDKIYTSGEFFADGNDIVLTNTSTSLYESKDANNLNKYYFELGAWRVVDDKGNTFYYGSDTLSRLVHPTDSSKVFGWYLQKRVDTRGNEIRYSYFKDQNQVYLDTITYAFSGNIPLYTVQFVYANKGKTSTSYRTQFEVKTSKILSKIQLLTGGQLTKEYVFTYDSLTEPFSHLTQVELLSGGVSFQKYNFSYGTGKDMHLLTQVITNDGKKYQFTYTPSPFYKENNQVSNQKLPFSMKTLSRIVSTDLVNNTSLTEDFSYAGGYYYFTPTDIFGREYAGFYKVTKSDSFGEKEVYYFHQGSGSTDGSTFGEYQDQISKKGRIFRVETYDGTTLLKKVITKWNSTDKGNGRNLVTKERDTQVLKNGTTSSNTYSYDSFGRLTQIVDFGKVSLSNDTGDFSDIENDKKTTSLQYANNTSKNILSFLSKQEVSDINNTLISKQELFYDSLGFGQVDFGDITSQKIYIDSTNSLTFQKSYNTQGLPIGETNPRGFTTTYTYDQYGLYPTQITNPKGWVQSLTYNYQVGKPNTYTDVNGISYSYTYDILGRVLQEQVITGGTKILKSYEYDDINLPNSKKENLFFDQNGTDSKQTITYLDAQEHPVQIKQRYNGSYSTTVVRYDALGRKVFVSYPDFTSSLSYTSSTSSFVGESYVYDVLDRVLSISNTSGNVSYSYGDTFFTLTNQKGVSTTYKYDIRGNLVEVVESGNLSTKYTYDTNNVLTRIEDAQGNRRDFVYDMLGRRLSAQDLHTQNDTNFGTEYYTYDGNGNILTRTTLGGQTISYSYDELDRVINESTSTESTSYTYDIGSYAKGLLSSFSKGNYSENYGYDMYGNKVSDSKNYNGSLYTLGSSYGLNGIKKTTTYPDGKVVSYASLDGFINGVTYNGIALTSSVSYNDALKFSALTLGNGASIQNTYDRVNGYRLTRKKLTSTPGVLSDINYTYDSVGNIITLQESGNQTDFQKNVTYGYDSLNRLTSTNMTFSTGASINLTYGYDGIGNMISNSELGSYTYTDNGRNNPHAVTSIGVNTYAYDDNGNINSSSGTTFSYNAKNQLLEVTNASGSVASYQYDIGGRRVSKTGSGFSNLYINKDYEVETTGSGTGQVIKTTKYIFLGDLKLASVESLSGQENIIYHQSDNLSGANIDLDSSGNILQTVDYKPYGGIRKLVQTNLYKNKYLFTGKERDGETGLDYFEARYYDSGVGRFRSIDPVFWEIGVTKRGKSTQYDPQQFNSYAYARNNPVIYIDLSGEAITFSGIIGAIFGFEYAGDESTAERYKDQNDSQAVVFLVSGVKNTGVEFAEKGMRKFTEKELKSIAKQETKSITKQTTQSETKKGGKVFFGVESPNISKEKGNIYNYTGTREEFDRYYNKLNNNKSDNYLNLRETSKGNSNTMKYDGPPTVDINEGGKIYKIKFKGN